MVVRPRGAARGLRSRPNSVTPGLPRVPAQDGASALPEVKVLIMKLVQLERVTLKKYFKKRENGHFRP